MNDKELLIGLAKLSGCEYCKNKKRIFEYGVCLEECCFADCTKQNKFELDKNKLSAKLKLNELIDKI